MPEMGGRALKPGDVVEVRSPAEILATLDENAALDAMPFMPEMIRFAGQRFTVTNRVEKICDTVSGSPPNSRRMRDTVMLDDLRCDGSGHGGCQAACRLYWKDSWLKPVDVDAEQPADPDAGRAELEALTHQGTRTVREDDGEPKEAWRCQATDALLATEPLSNYDPRQYIREVRAGNVTAGRVLRIGIRALFGMIGRRLHLTDYLPFRTKNPVSTKGELDLQPGDLAQVRSPEEIAPTVNEHGLTRGLSFDWEMRPYCGGRYRVQDRVEKIIDERNGQMIEIKSDCVILEGVVCSGEHSRGRWFCPRAIYPYWREAWLQPANGTEAVVPGSGADAAAHGSH
jgi:hypothetical protein